MRFSEIAKEQLAAAIQLRIHRAFPTLVRSRESWERDRRKRLAEWGDRPTVYIEYICEGAEDDNQVIADLLPCFLNDDGTLKEEKEDLRPARRDYVYEIEHNITVKSKRPDGFKDNGDGTCFYYVGKTTVQCKYYQRHMGAYLDEKPWWYFDGSGDGLNTGEDILMAGEALDMGNGRYAFTLDGLREEMADTCDARLVQLTDYKLRNLLRGLDCIEYNEKAGTEGKRHRYVIAWHTTRKPEIVAALFPEDQPVAVEPPMLLITDDAESAMDVVAAPVAGRSGRGVDVPRAELVTPPPRGRVNRTNPGFTPIGGVPIGGTTAHLLLYCTRAPVKNKIFGLYIFFATGGCVSIVGRLSHPCVGLMFCSK